LTVFKDNGGTVTPPDENLDVMEADKDDFLFYPAFGGNAAATADWSRSRSTTGPMAKCKSFAVLRHRLW
jgi:hypothetical protein